MTALFLALALAAAQSPAATLTGTVTDVTGAPLSGATITMVADTRRETTTTQPDGSFSLPVPDQAGKMTIRAAAPGFAPADRAVTLPSGPIRFELRPEGLAERITVS